jgi:SIT4-associating protein SAP185/190
MALLNDPRGEIIVRERDMERERLRKEGEFKRRVVDLWGDTTLRNDRQWAADPYSSDDSDDGEEKDKHDREIKVEQPRSGGEEKNPPVFDEPSGGPQQVNGSLTENLPTIHVEKEKQGWSESRLSPEIKSSESGPFISPPNSPANQLSNSDSGALTTNEDKNAMESGKPSDLVDATHAEHPVVGDYLKMKFVEARVLPSVVDLFFAHPWNNFLHNVVYDILTQVLNGPMDKGFNRQLAIDLFTTGQLTEKILDGQRASDEAQYVVMSISC